MLYKQHYFCEVNPRRAGEGLDAPFRFSAAISKTAVQAHLFINRFHTCCEHFRPRSLKVRSSGHVK